MRDMKDSGVSWIGQIPEEWNIVPSGSLFNEVKEKNTNLKYKNPLQFKYGNIIEKNNGEIDDSTESTLETYTCVEPDVIMINGLNLNYDFVSQRVAIVKQRGVITSAYLAVKADEEISIPEFACYLFKGYDGMQVFHGMGSGVRKTLQWKDFKKISFVLPTISEQKKIINQLDTQCSKVDTLIANQQSQIEKLKSYKQSLITEVVTKGLDMNVPMKDSGVDWIGEIPENFEIMRIVYILDKNHSYPIGDGDHGLIKTEDYQDSGIPYIRVSNLGWGTEITEENMVYISEEKNEMIKSSTLKPNDVLFAKTGATIGKTAIIPDSMPISNTTSHVGKISVSEEYNPKYIFHVLSSYIGFRQFWEIACQKTTRPELAISEIKTMFILVPKEKKIQDDIVVYIEEKCKQIDRLIAIKRQKIEKLQQYKKSLIYEYVTGKKEVK